MFTEKREKGTSKFVSLMDIEQSPELFAMGGIGDAMIDNSSDQNDQRTQTNARHFMAGGVVI